MPIETWSALGAKLRVRTGGAADAARTLVFAVDPPNALEHYAQTFVALQKSARLVAFEPPGFGRSTAPRGYKHAPEEAADVVIALLERLAAPRPAVLAFPCMSAYVALHVAAKRPDLVGGLVLMQAPSWEQERAWADRVDKRGVLRTPVLGQAALLFQGDPLVKRWYEAAVADPERAHHMSALAIELLDHGAKFPLASAFQASFSRGGAAAPPVNDRTPTLLVWGAADKSHKKSDPESAREHAPGADVVVIEDAGHFPELETPVRFRDEVMRWMDANAL